MFPFSRFHISGHSMKPLFKEGEKIVINHLAYIFSKPKPGQVVAIADRGKRGRILLKMIEKSLPGDKYIVVGVNKNDSLDSRSFGPIDRKQIIGRVWFKY